MQPGCLKDAKGAMVAYTLLDSGLLRYDARMRFNGEWEPCTRTAPFSARPGVPWDQQVAAAARAAPYSTGSSGFVLRQVRRNHDGLLGGFVADEWCLSQRGTCFVHDRAQVWAGGRVTGNAQVSGEAVIRGTVEDNAVVEGGEVEGRVGGQVRVRSFVPSWMWLLDGPHPWGNATTAAYALFTREFRKAPSAERLAYWAERVSALMEQNGVGAHSAERELEERLLPLTHVMRVTLEDLVDNLCADLGPQERERRLAFFREAMGHPVFQAGRRPQESAAQWMAYGLEWLNAYLQAQPHTVGGQLAETTRRAFRDGLAREPTPAEVAAVVVHWREAGTSPDDLGELLPAALGVERAPLPPEAPAAPDISPSATPEDLIAALMLNMAGNARDRGMLNAARLETLAQEARATLGGGPAFNILAEGLAALAGAPAASEKRPPARPSPPAARLPPKTPQELLANLRALRVR
jgi:hypothetical protein